MSRKLAWYFDYISPFAYLQLKSFARLPADLDIEPVPVLFAGLLRHWGTKGPVEVSVRGVHTFRQCVWEAGQRGIPFRIPPRHPFNPLPALRLTLALGTPQPVIASVFDFIWQDGRDLEQAWPELCERLGVPPAEAGALIADGDVKARLAANTDRAIAAGVWGVPTFEVGSELFWGLDTLEWMNAYLADPGLHERGEMLRAAQVEPATTRRH